MVLSLGDVSFQLGADTRGLSKAVQSLKTFGREVEAVSAKQDKASQIEAAAYRRQEKSITGALKRVQELNRVSRELGADPTNISAANRSLTAYTGALTSGALSALELQRANIRLDTSLTNVTRRLKDLKSQKQQTRFDELATQFQDLASAAIFLNGPLGGVAARFSAFASVIKRSGVETAAFIAGATAGVFVVSKLAGATLQAGIQIDTLRQTFLAVTGASVLAEQSLKDVESIANKAGLNFVGLAKDYGSFTAAVKNSNISGAEGKKIFETFAQAAGKLQLPGEQATRIFKALEQIISKGKVGSEELRQQLGDALPGAFAIAANASKKTAAEFTKMVENGEVTSDFLIKFAKEVKKSLNIDETPNKSFTASTERLKTSYTLLLAEFDKTAGISSTAGSFLDKLTGTFKFLRDNIHNVIGVLGALTGAFVSLAIPKLIPLVTGLVGAFTALRGAVVGLSLASIATSAAGLLTTLNPLTLALTAAAGGFLLFKNASQGTSDNLQGAIKDAQELTNVLNRTGKALGSIGDPTRNKLEDSLSKSRAELNGIVETMQGVTKETYNWRTGTTQTSGIYTQLSERASKLRREVEDGVTALNALDKASIKASKLSLVPSVTGDTSDKGKKSNKSGKAPIDHLKELQKALNDLQTQKSYTAITLGMNELDKELFDLSVSINKVTKEHGPLTFEMERQLAVIKEQVRENYKAKQAIEEKEAAMQLEQDTINTLVAVSEAGFARITDSISKMISEGKVDFGSLADASRATVSDIISTFARLAVINPIKDQIFGTQTSSPIGGALGSVFGKIGGFLGLRKGGALGPEGISKVTMARKGSMINKPTMFNSAAGPILGGEAGREAIMPLSKNGKGELGVRVADGYSQPNITININTPDVNSFRKSEAQVSSMIRRASNAGNRSA